MNTYPCRAAACAALFVAMSVVSGCGDAKSAAEPGSELGSKLVGLWVQSFDRGVGQLDAQMNNGVMKAASKFQFTDLQNFTWIRGQAQPSNGQWRVVSQNGNRMVINMTLAIEPGEAPQDVEFSVQFDSDDRLRMQLIGESDEPDDYVRAG